MYIRTSSRQSSVLEGYVAGAPKQPRVLECPEPLPSSRHCRSSSVGHWLLGPRPPVNGALGLLCLTFLLISARCRQLLCLVISEILRSSAPAQQKIGCGLSTRLVHGPSCFLLCCWQRSSARERGCLDNPCSRA